MHVRARPQGAGLSDNLLVELLSSTWLLKRTAIHKSLWSLAAIASCPPAVHFLAAVDVKPSSLLGRDGGDGEGRVFPPFDASGGRADTAAEHAPRKKKPFTPRLTPGKSFHKSSQKFVSGTFAMGDIILLRPASRPSRDRVGARVTARAG